MTLPVAELKANAEKALRLIWEHLGEQGIDTVSFDPKDSEWSCVLSTTWTRLEEEYWVEFVAGEYQLTDSGWLRVEGRFSDPTTNRERCNRMIRALSDVVTEEARQSHMTFEAEEIAQRTALPAGWVFNALRSNLVAMTFTDRECWVTSRIRGSRVEFTVPPHFGHPRFEL